MPLRNLVTLLLLSAATLPAFSQNLAWDFELFSTAPAGVEVRDIAVDSDGNIFVLGNFSNQVDFDPSGLGVTTRFSFANQNTFLAKYDRDGIFQFVRAIVGVGNTLATSLVMDGDNFVYITGAFRGNIQVQTGGAPTTENFVSNGDADIFVIKYAAATLLYQWAYIEGGTLEDGGNGIALDAVGNVFVTGGFNGTVDFDGAGALPASTSAGGEDLFVLKLNEFTGAVTYRYTFGSTGDERGEDIAVSSTGSVYVGGYFNGIMDVNPTAVTFNIVPTGAQDGFLLRYNDLGGTMTLGNAVAIGGTLTDEVKEVEVGRDDLPIVGANFQATTNLGGGVTATSAGNSDFIFAKYPLNLASPTWSHRIGGTGTEDLEDMELDRCDNIFVAGNYQGTVDFDPGAGTNVLTGPTDVGFNFYQGYFAGKYDLDGNLLHIGGEDLTFRDNSVRAIAPDPGGNMILGINADDGSNTDIALNGATTDRTPTAAATGQVVYITRSSTGRVSVDNTAATGDGTFDDAMDWIAHNANADTVCFCLTGAGPFTINKPAELVPVVADSTVFDGTTQTGWTAGTITVDGATSVGYGIGVQGVATEVYGLTIQGYESGIYLSDALNFVVGAAGRGNQLLSNTNYGLFFTGSYGTVHNNEIGTNAAATNNLGNGAGIGFDLYPAISTIGGFGLNEGNVIGFNGQGVYDLNGATNATIVGNTFACNSIAGILINTGSFAPVISTPDFSVIAGTGPANQTIHIYEVDNTACTGTVPCQGYSFIGSATSDGAGNWALPGAFTIGTQITATATSAAGKTSEFSLCTLIDAVLDQAFDDPEAKKELNPGWVIEQEDELIRFGRTETEFHLLVTDMQGRVIHAGIGQEVISMDTESLARGIYVISLWDNAGNSMRKKVMVR